MGDLGSIPGWGADIYFLFFCFPSFLVIMLHFLLMFPNKNTYEEEIVPIASLLGTQHQGLIWGEVGASCPRGVLVHQAASRYRNRR